MAVIKVDFKEAHELLTNNKKILLFDVREEEEYITGHARDAQLFTLADIDRESAREMIPSKDTPVMVYCRSGVRSREAAQRLSAFGYKTVYDIGGLAGWPYGLD